MYQQNPRRAQTGCSLFFWLFVCIMQADAASSLPPDMHSQATTLIHYLYNERYEEAEEEARKMVRKFPAHPAGYFFMATVLNSWMTAHMSEKKEDHFYRFCELTVDKGEKILENNPQDEWAKFFIGGAEGIKGTYEARYERWITAFRHGWKGVSILTQLSERSSNITDVLYGIGSYEYWRSALMKSLWWMPGVEDKRQEGIEKLRLARKTGVYAREASTESLVDIFLNEERFDEAFSVADEASQAYPHSRIFALGKGRALFGLKRYDDAQKAFMQVLKRVENDPNSNHATMALCHYWIARINLVLGRNDECIAAYEVMKSYQFNDDSKKALEKYFSEAEGFRKQAAAAGKNKPQKTMATKPP